MVKQKVKGTEELERAMNGVFASGKIASKLSQVLAYAAKKDTVFYQEIKEILKDDPEDVLFLADEWRLLLPVSTAKSSSWEDRLLVLKDGEIYEIRNIIRYCLEDDLHIRRWDTEKSVIRLFKELGDPDCKKIHKLVRSFAEEAVNHKITGHQIELERE